MPRWKPTSTPSLRTTSDTATHTGLRSSHTHRKQPSTGDEPAVREHADVGDRTEGVRTPAAQEGRPLSHWVTRVLSSSDLTRIRGQKFLGVGRFANPFTTP